MPRVYIVILNWNGWRDTVQCLESIFRSDYEDFRVVVCDNLSSDNSIERIQEWAEGKLVCEKNLNERLIPLISPPIKKPLPYVLYDQKEAEQGGKTSDEDIPLILVRNSSNGGYSAGNNTGIRYALKKRAGYVWLLNNDTLVTPETLKELVSFMESDCYLGAAGSIIYFADEPSGIQTYGGGRIIPFLGVDRFVQTPAPIHYVSGTSLFLKGTAIEQTGLLDEGFFFYWEDADYSLRILEKDWKLGVARKTAVYHKFSASVKGQSLKSDLFKVASLTRYFRKHYKFRWILPVSINLGGMVIKRLYRGQFNRIIPILKEFLKALRQKI